MIPGTKALIKLGYLPVIASDGPALELLKKEFPDIAAYELPSYNIHYSKNGNLLNALLIIQSGKIIKTAIKEQEVTQKIVERKRYPGLYQTTGSE
ncbi:MAG: hypothetical protein U5K51_01040 [Flavobacteriaceae bacterium]|nr:hypothetical protein [Flavobacteriaceae bacterium]